MRNRNIAIFDLDGTLHYTEKALVPAIRMAMTDLGFPPAPPEDINSLYGEPLEVFCRKLLNDNGDNCRAFRDGIRRHQKNTLPESGELYPGILKMLQEVSSLGFILAICSNAGMDYIELVTGSLSIRRMFSMLQGRDGSASKTERVKEIIRITGSKLAVMVGDRYHDIEAAFENGIPAIGCAYGYGGPDEMENADFVVKSPSEIAGILSELVQHYPHYSSQE